MRVAVVGVGAIGTHIANVLAGRSDLALVDRTRAPLADGEAPVDAAVVATKTPGTAWAASQVARMLAPDGVALTIQNGLGNYELLAETVGAERVALGVIYIGAGWHADGTHYVTGTGRIEAGRPAGAGPRRRLADLAERLRAGGMTVELVDDPWRAVWRKLVANAVLNPTSALLDATYGEILRDEGRALLCDTIARESARIATAAGFAISEDEAIAGWRTIARTMDGHRSSMHADVVMHRPTEVEAINGALVREAERRGIVAPANQAMTLLVGALGRD